MRTSGITATLPAQDLSRAKGFYIEKVGLQVAKSNYLNASDGRPGIMLGDGVNQFVIYPAEARSSGEYMQAVLQSTDVRAAVEEMKGRGVKFEEYNTAETVTENSVARTPDGREGAWFKDSEGNLIGVVTALVAPPLQRSPAWSKAARSSEERKADALAKLAAVETNVWMSTASRAGAVHLVPVSHTFNGSQVILATEATSITVGNVTANPRVSLALGETRDVVMIDAILIESVPTLEASAALSEGYAAQAGWDPRTDGGDYVYLVLGPERIQVWREAEDLAGRTVMRNGEWVI